MPLLKGGARYRNNAKKPKGTMVKKIKKIKDIGAGNEGNVKEIEFEIVKHGKTKKIKMAGKYFVNRDLVTNTMSRITKQGKNRNNQRYVQKSPTNSMMKIYSR